MNNTESNPLAVIPVSAGGGSALGGKAGMTAKIQLSRKHSIFGDCALLDLGEKS